MPVETRAWRSFEPPPLRAPTMITEEEQRYLRWLGARVWSGRGSVVEIGCWLGGSTTCLAAGMRESGHDAHKRLEVYDNFIWRSFMSERAALPLAAGDSFQAHFLAYTGEHADLIECRARALPDEVIRDDAEAADKRFSEHREVPLFEGSLGERVEILFIDGAKSWRGMRHLLLTLSESFLPGETLLVCQDFKYWGTYWVPILMMRLVDHLEPVHDVLGSTTLTFRLTRALPVERLRGFEDHVARLPTARGLAELRAASALLESLGDRRGAWNLRLCQVPFLAHQGLGDQAVDAFEAIQAGWPLSLPQAQLERARAFLAGTAGRAPARPLRLRAAALARLAARLRARS